MRNLRELDKFRVNVRELGHPGDHTCGAFIVPAPTGAKMRCVASVFDGWDHVSVSLPNRCPRWEEMSFIQRKFFLPTEHAMQLHVPAKDHINVHPYCLHLWRPHDVAIPLPPIYMV